MPTIIQDRFSGRPNWAAALQAAGALAIAGAFLAIEPAALRAQAPESQRSPQLSQRGLAEQGWRPQFTRIGGKAALVFWSDTKPIGPSVRRMQGAEDSVELFMSTASVWWPDSPQELAEPLLRIRQWGEPWGECIVLPDSSPEMHCVLLHHGMAPPGQQLYRYSPAVPARGAPAVDPLRDQYITPGVVIWREVDESTLGSESCMLSWLPPESGGPAILSSIGGGVQCLAYDLSEAWAKPPAKLQTGQPVLPTKTVRLGYGTSPVGCKTARGDLLILRVYPGGHESKPDSYGRREFSVPGSRRGQMVVSHVRQCHDFRIAHPTGPIVVWSGYWPCGWNQGNIRVSRGPDLNSLADVGAILPHWETRYLRLARGAGEKLWLLTIHGPASWNCLDDDYRQLPPTATFQVALTGSRDSGVTWDEPRILHEGRYDDVVGDLLVRERDILIAYSTLAPNGATAVNLITVDLDAWEGRK